jgi:hypothetical protein
MKSRVQFDKFLIQNGIKLGHVFIIAFQIRFGIGHYDCPREAVLTVHDICIFSLFPEIKKELWPVLLFALTRSAQLLAPSH